MSRPADQSFVLEFPPEPPFVGTARLFAAAVARSFGVDEDSVDDIKVAVSEACTSAIRARRDGMASGPVRLRARRDRDRLSFSAEDAGLPPDGSVPVRRRRGSSSDEIARRLGLEIVRALFPDTEIFSNDRGGADLRFSLEVRPPAA